MSEYQYYEWQTIDRLLTEEEQTAVNRLSSHIDVTPSQAIVTYDWGDFKHDPRQVLVRYFDAHFYWANWGSRRLMFRFPAGADLQALKPYCLPDYITLDQAEGAQVLEIVLDEDEGFEEWDAVEDGLSPYVRLRNDILQGDYRLLYLAWLKAISLEKDDPDLASEPEPPVPAGLSHLNAALNRFVRLVGVDRHLIQAAAAASTERQTISDLELRQAVAQLPRPECDEILFRLAKGEAGLSTVANQKLQPFLHKPPSQAASPRTVGQLFDAAKKLRH